MPFTSICWLGPYLGAKVLYNSKCPTSIPLSVCTYIYLSICKKRNGGNVNFSFIVAANYGRVSDVFGEEKIPLIDEHLFYKCFVRWSVNWWIKVADKDLILFFCENSRLQWASTYHKDNQFVYWFKILLLLFFFSQKE